MTNIEEQARDEFVKWAESEGKLVALTCEQAYGMKGDHRFISPTTSYAWQAWQAAWSRRALTPTGENAKHVEVKAEFEKWYSGLDHTPNFYGTWRAAWSRALSAPDNAEAVPRVVLREGLPTLVQDKNIKPSDVRLYTRPTPAARVSVVDLALAEEAAFCLDRGDAGDKLYAAAIYRLVQAVKGEK